MLLTIYTNKKTPVGVWLSQTHTSVGGEEAIWVEETNKYITISIPSNNLAQLLRLTQLVLPNLVIGLHHFTHSENVFSLCVDEIPHQNHI